VENSNSEILKVGSKTDPPSLAGAIAGQVRKNGSAEVQAIGAGSVNQLVKAVAIARSFFAVQDKDLCMYPSFMDVELEGETRTVIKVRVVPVPLN
jgi:stage V sporulation protein S